VNLLGHTHVALAGGRDDAGWLLGAVLPDLAPMAGVRVRRAHLEGALGEGVRCHLRADEVFHAHPLFRESSAALRRDLSARDVPRGAARAVAHAGWEMLLDGTLVGSESEAAFHRAMADVGRRAVDAIVTTPDDAARWLAFVDRAGGVGDRSGVRLRYDDPAWVADRLHAMLARRPRLALPAGDVAAVADVLAAHADTVGETAATVLADTAAAVHTG
jgi:hypothetical protein